MARVLEFFEKEMSFWTEMKSQTKWEIDPSMLIEEKNIGSRFLKSFPKSNRFMGIPLACITMVFQQTNCNSRVKSGIK